METERAAGKRAAGAAPFPVVGALPVGPADDITDAGGLRVGHCTLARGPIQTGVTVIAPEADPVLRRPLAACAVFNGFGKSVGLMQLAELHCLETPIALTNTFAVGSVATAQIRAAVAAHPAIGRDWPTVNPLVLECNDGWLNDLQAFSVTEAHYAAALEDARDHAPGAARRGSSEFGGPLPRGAFAQGSAGAGRGMSCFHCKGGIGSASRITPDGVVGALVLANFGRPEQCILAGRPVGALLQARIKARTGSRAGMRADVSQKRERADEPEKGSIIMILATDAPADAAQLERLARRAGNGLARTGSVFGHGSGDVAVAFSTCQSLPWPEGEAPVPLLRLPDHRLDALFQAAAEAVEQAVLKALFLACPVTGRDGRRRAALPELLPEWRDLVAWPVGGAR